LFFAWRTGKMPTVYKETALFAPVADWLRRQGYDVQAEVRHCDVVARKGEELVAVELKRSFSLGLLVQAVRRQKAMDSVYVAVPRPARGRFGKAWRDMAMLLRRLDLGCITVNLAVDPPMVKVEFHPPERRISSSYGKTLRRAILREIEGRSGAWNVGGSTRTKLMTAYREKAVHAACLLEVHGRLSPAGLRGLGGPANAQAVLYHNHYGWFERVAAGVYEIAPEGRTWLAANPELAGLYREKAAVARAAASPKAAAPAPAVARRRPAANKPAVKKSKKR
jgi:hypothetical protein